MKKFKELPKKTKKTISAVLAVVIAGSAMGPLLSVFSSANYTSFDYIEDIMREKSTLTNQIPDNYNVFEIVPDVSQSAMSYYINADSVVDGYVNLAEQFASSSSSYNSLNRKDARKTYMYNYYKYLSDNGILGTKDTFPIKTSKTNIADVYDEKYPWENTDGYKELELSEPDTITVNGSYQPNPDGNNGYYDIESNYSLAANIFDFDEFAGKFYYNSEPLLSGNTNYTAYRGYKSGDKVTLNKKDESITFEKASTRDEATGSKLYTTYTSTLTYNVGVYSMTVQPNTTYTLTFKVDLSATKSSVTPAFDFSVYSFLKSGTALTHLGETVLANGETVGGAKTYTFKTSSRTNLIQFKFGTATYNTKAKFSEIELTSGSLFNINDYVYTSSENPRYWNEYGTNKPQIGSYPAMDGWVSGDTLSFDMASSSVIVEKKGLTNTDYHTICAPQNNVGYYTIPVTSGVQYTFSYDLSLSASDDRIEPRSQIVIYGYYEDNGVWKECSSKDGIIAADRGQSENGKHDITFTVPDDVQFVQVSFGTMTGGTKAVFSNVKLVNSSSIFSFSDYADTVYLGEPKYRSASGYVSASSGWNKGNELSFDNTTDTFVLSNNSSSTTSFYNTYGELTSNVDYYRMQVVPKREYTISFYEKLNKLGTNASLKSSVSLIGYTSTGEVTSSVSNGIILSETQSASGIYSYSFTVPADVVYVQISFGIKSVKTSAEFSNIIVSCEGNRKQSVVNYEYYNTDPGETVYYYGETPTDIQYYYYALEADRYFNTKEALESITKDVEIYQKITVYSDGETNEEATRKNVPDGVTAVYSYFKYIGTTGVEVFDIQFSRATEGIYCTVKPQYDITTEIDGVTVSLPAVTDKWDEYHHYRAVPDIEIKDKDKDGIYDTFKSIFLTGSDDECFFVCDNETFTYNSNGSGAYDFVQSSSGEPYQITTSRVYYKNDVETTDLFDSEVFDHNDKDPYEGFKSNIKVVATSDLTDESPYNDALAWYDFIAITTGTHYGNASGTFSQDISRKTKEAILEFAGIDNNKPILVDVAILNQDESTIPVLYSLVKELVNLKTIGGNIDIKNGGVRNNIYAFNSADVNGVSVANGTFNDKDNPIIDHAIINTSSPYYDVHSEITDENYFRTYYKKSSDDLIPEYITQAACIRSIINYAGRRLSVGKKEIRILDIEPYTSSRLTETVNKKNGTATLCAMDVLSWLVAGDAYYVEQDGDKYLYYVSEDKTDPIEIKNEEDAKEVIKITTMSVAELNTSNQEIMENYDMIYIGDSIENLTSRATKNTNGFYNIKYNDVNMTSTGAAYDKGKTDGSSLIYTSIGDVYTVGNKGDLIEGKTLAGLLREDYTKFTENIWNINSSYTFNARTDGNDITDNVRTQLEKFAAAGLPVVYADGLVVQPKSAAESKIHVQMEVTSAYRTSSQDFIYFIATIVDANGNPASFPRDVEPIFRFRYIDDPDDPKDTGYLDYLSGGDEAVGWHKEMIDDEHIAIYGTLGGVTWDKTVGADVTKADGTTLKNYRLGMTFPNNSGEKYQKTLSDNVTSKYYFDCEVELSYPESGDAAIYQAYNGKKLYSDRVQVKRETRELSITYSQTDKISDQESSNYNSKFNNPEFHEYVDKNASKYKPVYSKQGCKQTITVSPNPFKINYFSVNEPGNTYGEFYKANFGDTYFQEYTDRNFDNSKDVEVGRRFNLYFKWSDSKDGGYYDDCEIKDSSSIFYRANWLSGPKFWESYVTNKTNDPANGITIAGNTGVKVTNAPAKTLLQNTEDTFKLLYDCREGTGEDAHVVRKELTWHVGHGGLHGCTPYQYYKSWCYLEVEVCGTYFYFGPQTSEGQYWKNKKKIGDNMLFGEEGKKTQKVKYYPTEVCYTKDVPNTITLAQNIVEHVDWAAIDNTSNLYKFMSQVFDTYTITDTEYKKIKDQFPEMNIDALKSQVHLANVMTPTDILEGRNSLVDALKLSPPNLVVDENSLQSYNESNPQPLSNNLLRVRFSLFCDSDLRKNAQYKVELFIDANHDAIYSPAEKVDITTLKKGSSTVSLTDENYLIKGNKSNETAVVYTLEKSIPSTYQGVLPWKLVVTDADPDSSYFHDSYTGYAYVAQDNATVINALQILPGDQWSNTSYKKTYKNNASAEGFHYAQYTIRGTWKRTTKSAYEGNTYLGSVFMGTDSKIQFTTSTTDIGVLYDKDYMYNIYKSNEYTDLDKQNDAFLQLIQEDGTKLQRTVYYEDIGNGTTYFDDKGKEKTSDIKYRAHVELWVNPKGEKVPKTDANGDVVTDYFGDTVYKYEDCDFEVNIALTDIWEIDNYIYLNERSSDYNKEWLNQYNMLIMGFGDNYGKQDTLSSVDVSNVFQKTKEIINPDGKEDIVLQGDNVIVTTLGFTTYAAFAIEDYIKSGKPVLFCHDTTNKETNFIVYWANSAYSWATGLLNDVEKFWNEQLAPFFDKIGTNIKNWWYTITNQKDKIVEYVPPQTIDENTLEANVSDSRVRNGYYNNLILRGPLRMDRYGITYSISKLMESGSGNDTLWEKEDFRSAHKYTWLLKNSYQPAKNQGMKSIDVDSNEGDGESKTGNNKYAYVSAVELMGEGFSMAYQPGTAARFDTAAGNTIIMYRYYNDEEYVVPTNLDHNTPINKVSSDNFVTKKYTNNATYEVRTYDEDGNVDPITVTYGGDVYATYVQQTQGFTKWEIVRYGIARTNDNKNWNTNENLPVGITDESKPNSGEPIMTNKIVQVNKGSITSYPYDINTVDFGGTTGDENGKITINPTHQQVYQLNLNNGDTTVWYTLAGSEDEKENGKTLEYSSDYDLVQKDGANSYYIFTAGNLTYTGAGHGNMFTKEEAKLFINTLVAAYRVTEESPSVAFRDESDTTNISYQVISADETKAYDSAQSDKVNVTSVSNIDGDVILAIKGSNPNLADTTKGEQSSKQLGIMFATALDSTDVGSIDNGKTIKIDLYKTNTNGTLSDKVSNTALEPEVTYYFKVPESVLKELETEESTNIYAQVYLANNSSVVSVPASLEIRRLGLDVLT